VPRIDAGALVDDEAHQMVVPDAPPDRVVAEYLVNSLLSRPEPVDVEDQNPGLVDESGYLHRLLLGSTFLAFVVLVERFFSLELEVLLGAVCIDVLGLVLRKLSLDLALPAGYLDCELGPENRLELLHPLACLLQLVLEVLK
jgi:hypothetical protein